MKKNKTALTSVLIILSAVVMQAVITYGVNGGPAGCSPWEAALFTMQQSYTGDYSNASGTFRLYGGRTANDDLCLHSNSSDASPKVCLEGGAKVEVTGSTDVAGAIDATGDIDSDTTITSGGGVTSGGCSMASVGDIECVSHITSTTGNLVSTLGKVEAQFADINHGVSAATGTFSGLLTADSAEIGGGFHSTGCTISNLGVIQCDDTINTDSDFYGDDIYISDDGFFTGRLIATDGMYIGYPATYGVDSAGIGTFASGTTIQGKLNVTGTIDPTDIILSGNLATAIVDITQAGAGDDIEGTGATWSITKAGLADFATVTLTTENYAYNSAVQKSYVDAMASGQDPAKQLANVKASPNFAIGTWPRSGSTTLDGISCVVGDRVLITEETGADKPYNGVWEIAIPWTRPSDFNTTAEATESAWVIVESGTNRHDSGWYLATAPTTLDAASPNGDMDWVTFTGGGVATTPNIKQVLTAGSNANNRYIIGMGQRAAYPGGFASDSVNVNYLNQAIAAIPTANLQTVTDAGAGTTNAITTAGYTTSFNATASRFISTVAIGSPPMTVTSTTNVTNFNADYLDSQHGSYYMPATTDNWVNTTGDTMTGALAMSGAAGDITFDNSGGTISNSAAGIGVRIADDLEPNSNDTRTMGSNSLHWMGAYIENLYATDAVYVGATGSTSLVNMGPMTFNTSIADTYPSMVVRNYVDNTTGLQIDAYSGNNDNTDRTFLLNSYGKNSTPADFKFGNIEMGIQAATAGSEAGFLKLKTKATGSTPAGGYVSFEMYGSSNEYTILNSPFYIASEYANVDFVVLNTNNSALGAKTKCQHSRGTGVLGQTNDSICEEDVVSYDSGNAEQQYASQTWYIADNTAYSEDAKVVFSGVNAGAKTTWLQWNGVTDMISTSESFSTNVNLAATGSTYLGSNYQNISDLSLYDADYNVYLYNSLDGAKGTKFINTYNGDSAPVTVKFHKKKTTAATDGTDLGVLNFNLTDGTDADKNYAYMSCEVGDYSDKDGKCSMYIAVADSATPFMTWDGAEDQVNVLKDIDGTNATFSGYASATAYWSGATQGQTFCMDFGDSGSHVEVNDGLITTIEIAGNCP